MGDNIYGDSLDPLIIAKKYKQQINHQDYRPFLKGVPSIGTWDDHDYGWKGAGAEYPAKRKTRDLALDFLQYPSSHPIRTREGLYAMHSFGPAGQEVQVILLDVRYFAETKKMKKAELLGTVQKIWLAKTIRHSTAEVILIVSGIQILPKDHKYGKWANFPDARNGLLELLDDASLPHVILLSGDRHFHEFSQIHLPTSERTMLEITSSGLTHSWVELKEEKNRYRLGEFYNQTGFGLLQFMWGEQEVFIRAEIRNTKNKGVIRHDFSLPIKAALPTAHSSREAN